MKTRKPLWKLSVATTLEAEDAVAELLGEIFGCRASSFFNAVKKISRVTVFISDRISPQSKAALRQGLNHIKDCGLEIGTGKIFISKVRREDWAESWKRHFKPLEIGDALLVKPGWSKKRPREGQAMVILNPGLSFGTGQHPTTHYCLEEIVRCSGINTSQDTLKKNGPSFLDIGTGSAILAIAAAKLGYQPILAIDLDPEAVRVGYANARANGVLKKIKFVHSDVAKLPIKPVKKFDVICANLISDVLIKERRRIVAQLNTDGVLALSGILKTEFSAVQKKFEELGLKLIRSRSKKEWRSGSFAFGKNFER